MFPASIGVHNYITTKDTLNIIVSLPPASPHSLNY